MLKKYFHIIKIAIEDGLTYRINVLMWRIRLVLGFFGQYYFWLAVMVSGKSLYGYSHQMMITYVVVSYFLYPYVFSTRTADVATEIATGKMTNYLLKPIHYIKFWAGREIADKIINAGFGLLEIIILYYLLNLKIIWPNNFYFWPIFLLIIILAIVLNFFINILVSMTTFWFREDNGWPVRFLFMMITSLIAGSFIPLDMFPPFLYKILSILPTSYVTFIPIQIWLGRITGIKIAGVILTMIIWIIFLLYLIKFVWKKGLKIYENEGR